MIGGSTDQNSTVQIRLEFLDKVRNESNVAIPTFLFPVNRQVYLAVFAPFIQNLLIIYQIILGTGTVNDVQRAIGIRIFTLLVTAIIDYRTERSQTDTAGDEQQILTLQTIVAVFLSGNGFYREVLSQRFILR